MKRKFTFLLLLFVHIVFLTNAQVPTNQDCLGSIPICQNVYSTTTSYSNTGNYPTEINTLNSCLGSGEKNDVWYTFSVQQTGNLSFNITPNNSSDDYDWAVYNLTNNNCADIYNNAALEVSCNFSATSGVTGPNGQGSTNSEDASGVNDNLVIPVTQGQTYVVNVSNFSSTQTGYTIDFGSSTAVIFDNIPPTISSIVTTPGCGSSSMTFTMSENILCSTVQSTDFNVTGPGGPYTVTSITGAGCAAGGTYENTFTVSLTPAVSTSGSYSLNLNPSASGSVTDLCGNVAPAGSLAFNITAITINMSSTDATCGQSNGSASITASGGSGTFTYTWNTAPVQTTATASGLPAGTYNVTVSDGGCSATNTVNVSNIGGPTVQTSFTNASCGLNNGTATVNASGGSGSYTYTWNTTPQQTTQTASNIGAGTYSVTVNDGTCVAVGSATIGNTAAPTLSTTFTNENCGHSNGTASVTVNGGSTPITYTWNTIPQQTTQAAANLPAGNYTVTVDAAGCIVTTNVSITNIAGPSASISNILDERCSYGNGSATVSVSGGTPGYTYIWNCVPAQYSATMSNVAAGTYSVTVTDNLNCTAINSATITNTPPPTAQISNTIPATCGMSDGSITVTPNGGTPGYSYNWNTNPPQGSATASAIPTGTYSVTITDANSCSATASGSVGVIGGPTATVSSTNEICDQSNGSASVTASGGSGTYNYTWSTTPPQYSANATNLAAGSYTITVDDGNCTYITTTSLINIPGPIADFSAHPNTITLLDGPVTFTDNSSGNIVTWNWTFGDGSSSGIQEQNHLYENLGTFPVVLIVTDDNGCQDTAVDTIKVKEIFTIYIPNVFTPNNDGLNEIFMPEGLSIDPNNYEMAIFDRWGKLVFITTNLKEGWNGTLKNGKKFDKAMMDTYVYRIKLKEIDGPKHEYIGRVALIP